MKKTVLLTLSFVVIAASSVYFFANSGNSDTTNPSEPTLEELRAQHQYHLDNSPFKETVDLSREERKALGLPPNGYNEQMWELTLDPQTGRPMPERVAQVQVALRKERENNRGVGGDVNNPWIERGPSSITLSSTNHPAGGRTRGIMFDPNDPNNERVFAGGVSGGLWVNDDITDVNSSWTLVPGIGANIAVKVIISDPNDSNTFYLGSGESYTSGQAIGNGIWKSTDAGVTWTNIFGGYTGVTGTQLIDGIFYINDIVARDLGATTELYASIAGAYHRYSPSGQWHGLQEQGLYKSVDNGANWTKFIINDGSGYPKNPNDIELDINNNIWFTTTYSSWGSSNGGDIYRSTDGLSFTLVTNIPGARRTEIEPSATNANEFWVAANVPGATQQVDLFYTNDAFATAPTALAEPADANWDGFNGIPPTDFTRGQAWYDLEIEADASGNLYVGGIDLFRSTDNGATWNQISQWYNFGAGVSLVHADQQAIVFRPGNDNQMVFGTDGGVYYSNDISVADASLTAIEHRNKDYSTIQFYYGAIDDVDGADGDDIIGGAQDNGTSAIIDAAPGANVFIDLFGGDGSYTELNRSHNYGIQTYTGNRHRYFNYPTNTIAYQIASGSGGNFINEAELDRNLDILYSNATTNVPVYRIERNATFTGGSVGITRTFLTNALLNSSPSAFKVSPYTAASTKLLVGLANGRLIRIDNADGAVAPTWTNITGSFVGSISDIEFGATELDIFVTIHNYGVTSVWATDDGGTTWRSIEGDLPDIPVKCILQNPLYTDQVIIGTALGVWATNDYTAASPTWVQAYNGMSDVAVLDLDLRTSDNVILASTHGRGMFTSQFTALDNLSVTENSLRDKGITIFPTVNDGNFNIVAKNNMGNIDMTIYSVTGKLVHDSKFNLSNSRKEFNLNIDSGIYFVNIKGESVSGTQKIVIK